MLRAVGLLRYERARARTLRRMRRAPGKPIVVYTIGKTGSSTVLATLAEAVPDRPVYQVHHLQPERVERSERHYRSLPRPIATGHVLAAQYLSRHRPPTPDDPWDVITLVREPVAQDVSVFFQVGERRGLFRLDGEGRLVEPASVDELVERFRTWRDHEDDVRWFDDDFAPSLGIDVYARPFDAAAGFARYDGDRARVLLLRNEDLRRVGSAALGDFLGIDPPALVAANVGAEKRYAEVYAEFRSRPVPAELAESLYGSKLARHFYSAAELDGFRAAWLR